MPLYAMKSSFFLPPTAAPMLLLDVVIGPLTESRIDPNKCHNIFDMVKIFKCAEITFRLYKSHVFDFSLLVAICLKLNSTVFSFKQIVRSTLIHHTKTYTYRALCFYLNSKYIQITKSQ